MPTEECQLKTDDRTAHLLLLSPAASRRGTSGRLLACAAVRGPEQALALLKYGGMTSFINLGPYSYVRVELLRLAPTGPYRLTIEHPAKTVVEYFDSPFAAMNRTAEIERVLTQP